MVIKAFRDFSEDAVDKFHLVFSSFLRSVPVVV